MPELPLIIFTLTLQMAIGAFLLTVLARLKKPEAGFYQKNTRMTLILTAVGLLASLVHLGKPYLAVTSLSRLSDSWLSREIFFSGGFFVLLFLAWLLERNPKIGRQLKLAVGIVTSLCGLAAVFSMAQSYMSTVYPAWQSWNTLVDFYAGTLVLGALLFIFLTGKDDISQTFRLDRIILGTVLLQLLFLVTLSTGSGAASALALTSGYTGGVIIRWLLVCGGTFLVLLSRSEQYRGKVHYFYLASAVLFLGVIVGRFLFYAAGTGVL